MRKILFITSEKSIKSKNNPDGLWTLKELIIFSINTKAKIIFTDCGIEINHGLLQKVN